MRDFLVKDSIQVDLFLLSLRIELTLPNLLESWLILLEKEVTACCVDLSSRPSREDSRQEMLGRRKK